MVETRGAAITPEIPSRHPDPGEAFCRRNAIWLLVTCTWASPMAEGGARQISSKSCHAGSCQRRTSQASLAWLSRSLTGQGFNLGASLPQSHGMRWGAGSVLAVIPRLQATILSGRRRSLNSSMEAIVAVLEGPHTLGVEERDPVPVVELVVQVGLQPRHGARIAIDEGDASLLRRQVERVQQIGPSPTRLVHRDLWAWILRSAAVADGDRQSRTSICISHLPGGRSRPQRRGESRKTPARARPSTKATFTSRSGMPRCATRSSIVLPSGSATSKGSPAFCRSDAGDSASQRV